ENDLVLAAKAQRNLAREAAEHLVRGVHHEPGPLDVLRLGGEGFHREIAFRVEVSKVLNLNSFSTFRSRRGCSAVCGPRAVPAGFIPQAPANTALGPHRILRTPSRSVVRRPGCKAAQWQSPRAP